MAKIINAKPKTSSGGYRRLFNHNELGILMTKIQSAVISNGTELEKLILKFINQNLIIQDCDEFFNNCKNSQLNNMIGLIDKKTIKKSKLIKFDKKFEPDFIILQIDNSKKCCYIIELKDGFEFDTKKISGERKHLEEFENYIAKKIEYLTKIKFCCFNENDKEKIKIGLKSQFNIEEIMTGKEFCDLIQIDYNKIIEYRKLDGMDNLNYFISGLLEIEDIKKLIVKELNK